MKKPSIFSRAKKAWNIFMNRDLTYDYHNYGPGFSYRPDRPRLVRGGERTIVTSVYNRIAMDVAAVNIYHVRLDENNRFSEVINSGLNNCLTLEANIDQTGRNFKQDIILSMLDEGCVAIVPIDTDSSIDKVGAESILTMRTGRVEQWYPDNVQLSVYNDRTGQRQSITLPKKSVGLIENPLYSVINEPNSTMQRLIRKLTLLDAVDEQTSSGKLDLIIQLPYTIKTELRRQQAERRRKDIEEQLSGSKYGIAYTDGTERITQLNRGVENNLMSQVEYLTNLLYSQLGITQAVLDGTADERTMLSYYSRTIEPFLSAISDELKRKFLTKTARSQGQSIMFFRDPFKLVPIANLADIADRMTRNEIMTSNEIRQIMGMKPSQSPNADELRNKNLNAPEGGAVPEGEESDGSQELQNGDNDLVNSLLQSLEKDIDDIITNATGEEEVEQVEDEEEEDE